MGVVVRGVWQAATRTTASAAASGRFHGRWEEEGPPPLEEEEDGMGMGRREENPLFPSFFLVFSVSGDHPHPHHVGLASWPLQRPPWSWILTDC